MTFLRSGLSHHALSIVAESYEVDRHELIRDARAAWTWHGPADDLVEHISSSHTWSAGMTVSYLLALRRARLWNRPDRGW
jgi:hypothetical protein